MKRILATIILSLAALLLLNQNPSYADPNHLGLNSQIEMEGSGKDKFQLKVEKDDRFTMKGVIEAAGANSLTINGNVITLDSSVTGDTKVVGKIENGMYAHVKGVMEGDSFLATQVVIDQRFKNELNENENEQENVEENETPTPTLTVSPTPTGTQSAEIESENKTSDLSRLIERLQEILGFLTSFVSKI